MRKVLLLPVAAVILLSIVAIAGAQTVGTEALVTNASPTAPFSQNKQNEPAVAIDAGNPTVLAAGANDNIDEEACNAGADNTCPFTPGVGGSGVYFSFDSGKTWNQPTYTGYSARNCLGSPGPDANCQPQTAGPIGTLPWYFENGLVSDGDPALAFGPKPDANGHFSWDNGSRLYYGNLTSNFPATRSDQSFSGFEAIGVSRTDDPRAAAADGKSAWKPPVLVSKQNTTTFSDKDQVWADNSSSSPFFGNVYVCWANFKGQEKGNAAPAPLQVAVSSDGGNTWTQHQIGSAANNGQNNPADGCTIRTGSNGVAYVFGVGTSAPGSHQAFELMSRSFNGGKNWEQPRPVAGPVTQPGLTDPNTGRPAIDGLAGARSDLAPAPSVDIANGAPDGTDATNRIVMTYVSGDLASPHVFFTESTDGGNIWSAPRAIESSSEDRPIYTAPAISPDGTTTYVVYNAFRTPYQATTNTPRSLVGVVLDAISPTSPSSPTGAFTEIHRGASGDPRSSSQNDLTAEFLGDYVYAAATSAYGVAVWNDSRNGDDCAAIDTWRQAIAGGSTAAPPAPEQDCATAPQFGNSDIYSFTTAP